MNINKYYSYHVTKSIVTKLKLRGQIEWYRWCKNKKIDNKIPTGVLSVYKTDWKGWDDFLGKELSPKFRKFYTYKRAKKFLKQFNLKTHDEYVKFVKDYKFLYSRPIDSYKNEWKGWDDYLSRKKQASFIEARNYAHKLKYKSLKEWNDNVNKLPSHIPKSPESVYKKQWRGIEDFLGYSNTKLSYYEARKFVRNLKLKTSKEWFDYHDKYKPINLPKQLEHHYKLNNGGWINWYSFFGIKKHRITKIISYDDAKSKIKNLKLKNKKSYVEWWYQTKPINIPQQPQVSYSNSWKGWGEFLSNKSSILFNKNKNLSFVNLKQIVQNKRFKTIKQYKLWAKKNKHILCPDKSYYDNGWKDWFDFLGTKKRMFLPYCKAIKLIHELKFNSQIEYFSWHKKIKPNNVPASPNEHYKDNGWTTWYAYLGYEKKISLGEEIVKKTLNKLNVNYIPQYQLGVNGRQKFDFFLPKYNVAIEYDGSQHFMIVNNGWNNKKMFKKIKEWDVRKNKYCKEHRIKLIRIPYTKFNDIEQILLEQYKIGFSKTINFSKKLMKQIWG